MSDLHVPDVSKWQGNVDFTKVGPAIILRAHSGLSADPTFASRQVLARKHCLVRGYYLFLVKGRDAATQGREFAQVVGKLQPGEFAVVDAEEGDGDQSARVEACADAIDAACGGKAWVYASLSFRASHLARITGRRWWIAAYRSTEPAGDQTLWQHTDSEPHPGIGPCDCSIFHGSVQQLRDLISPPAAVKTQATSTPTVLLAKPFTTLRRGSHGDVVAHLQRDLQRVYGSKTEVGPQGHYDDKTAAAVARLRHDTTRPPGDIGPGDFDSRAAHKIGWNV